MLSTYYNVLSYIIPLTVQTTHLLHLKDNLKGLNKYPDKFVMVCSTSITSNFHIGMIAMSLTVNLHLIRENLKTCVSDSSSKLSCFEFDLMFGLSDGLHEVLCHVQNSDYNRRSLNLKLNDGRIHFVSLEFTHFSLCHFMSRGNYTFYPI